MKFLTDLFPVILFFAAYWLTRDMFLATAIAIGATVVIVALTWLRFRKVDTMQWVSLALIVVMGGATLLLHDKHFIMWKPTVLYWLMGGGLLVGQLTGRIGMRSLMGSQMTLPDSTWKKLNIAWSVFFLLLGAVNLVVAYNFSEEVWVNFKLFGGFGLMIVFVIAQSLYLSKYIEETS
ncbi:septation protein A [Vogesella oryzae]|uniref:septation protein A n=1 Tax=Vogesella oryzae TaxID=1735285 RepID=UPI001582E562|nr:septation protein A [Vogesella oryzae]